MIEPRNVLDLLVGLRTARKRFIHHIPAIFPRLNHPQDIRQSRQRLTQLHRKRRSGRKALLRKHRVGGLEGDGVADLEEVWVAPAILEEYAIGGMEEGNGVAAAKMREDHQAQLCWEVDEAAWGGGGARCHGGLVAKDGVGECGLSWGLRCEVWQIERGRDEDATGRG
jgi:hypothetical protein